MFKDLLDRIIINVLNIELYTVHSEWRHKGVISPYSRLYYITNGEGSIRIGNENILLEPEYIYLIPAFTKVDMYCPNSFTHYYIHFTTELSDGHNLFSLFNCSHKIKANEYGIAKDIFEKLLTLNPGMELVERDANKPIYGYILKRHKALNQSKPICNIIETNAFMRLLLAQFFKAANSQEDMRLNAGINRFENTIKYINRNLNTKITLTQLAKTANLNPAYFSALFKRHIGVSPLRYVNTKKVERSQTLLLATDKTLQAIAEGLGYDDVFYFSRIFKQITGLPPATYRKQSQHI